MKILYVGKIGSDYQKLINEYSKQLPSLEFDSVKECNDRVKETKKIISKINPNDYIIVLDLHGHQFSTFDFYDFIENILPRNVCFVIGGSNGLDVMIDEVSNYKLSLSKSTLSHALAQVVLLEQIYRYFMIKKNHPYHK